MSLPLPPDVAALAVVIPARDEQDVLAACLHSVLAALDEVARPGLATTVVLVAHRCTDLTAAVAREALAGRGAVRSDDSTHVAGARRAGASLALERLQALAPEAGPARTWLLSTDADTIVPADWVARLLAHTGPTHTGPTHSERPAHLRVARGRRPPDRRTDRVAAVAGLAALDGWDHGERAWQAYHRVVRAGIDGERHRHAYAANLAVRADTYLDVGGWPDVVSGEDHALLSALTVRGYPVVRPTDVVVSTSSRRQARAAGGLGDLIDRLASVPAAELDVESWGRLA